MSIMNKYNINPTLLIFNAKIRVKNTKKNHFKDKEKMLKYNISIKNQFKIFNGQMMIVKLTK